MVVAGVVAIIFIKKRSGVTKSDHITLQKKTSLPQDITKLVDDEREIMDEFSNLESRVLETINKSSDISKTADNVRHNRYGDMGE